MDPLSSELRVIEAAEALARTLGGDPNHTVAAAALDTAGTIHSAVNVFHFTGGPCAELVVLGVAAAAKAGPLLAIAAAGDRGRGLIPPCGRCRQVLLDQHPDVLVAVPGGSGPTMVPVHKLLPSTYFYPDSDARRVLRFNSRYAEDVRSGAKTTTVRWDERVAEGPVLVVFEDHPEHLVLDGEVLAVEHFSLESLTTEQAGLNPADDIDALRAGLRQHYPDMPDDATVAVVRFAVVDQI